MVPSRGSSLRVHRFAIQSHCNGSSARETEAMWDRHPQEDFMSGRADQLPADPGGHSLTGCGLGLRREHYDVVVARRPRVPFFELISENFMVEGGRPLHVLD